jgi:hypothetical protein
LHRSNYRRLEAIEQQAVRGASQEQNLRIADRRLQIERSAIRFDLTPQAPAALANAGGASIPASNPPQDGMARSPAFAALANSLAMGEKAA